jgi:glycerol-3-phosphate dehydrogenase (NAD(P)+)
MFEKISIIGAGSWGSALAILLADHGRPITLWGHNSKVVEEINTLHTNSAYIPDIAVPPNVRATSDLADALEAPLIFMVTPSKAVRSVAGMLATLKPKPGAIIVSCTKGIEHGSGKLMGEVIEECLPECRLAVLSGPNLALEIARRIPAASVIGSAHQDILEPLQQVLSVKGFRPYTSDDVMGIQLGGALKNIFAIAAGVSDGFKMGDNAKAALVTRSLAEMARIGIALGGRRETFFGLSGVGDLMATCFSKQSRNRLFGERLGRGEKPAQIIESMRMVAEGVPTTLSAWDCAKRFGIEAPVTQEIHAVLYEDKSLLEAMAELMERPPKSETEAGIQPK